jgi:AP-1-like factor
MDYPYYTAAPQSYQFLGLPTPAHSGSANSDDFSNSPVRGAPLNLASPISSHNSHYPTQQDPSPSSPHPPVYPPQHHQPHHFLTQKQDAFDQYQQNYNFPQFDTGTTNGLPPQPKPPTPQSRHKGHKPSFNPKENETHVFDMNMEMPEDGIRRGSNSDDDENLTPAQSKRKAQNRAAYVLPLLHPQRS